MFGIGAEVIGRESPEISIRDSSDDESQNSETCDASPRIRRPRCPECNHVTELKIGRNGLTCPKCDWSSGGGPI